MGEAVLEPGGRLIDQRRGRAGQVFRVALGLFGQVEHGLLHSGMAYQVGGGGFDLLEAGTPSSGSEDVADGETAGERDCGAV